MRNSGVAGEYGDPPRPSAALNEHYPELILPIAAADLQRLPRSIGYRYQLASGCVQLVPQPLLVHTLRTLIAAPNESKLLSPGYHVRPLCTTDWRHLPELFATAFGETLPFRVLPAAECEALAAACVGRTQAGDDGPLLPAASFVVTRAGDDLPVAAVLPTLTPRGPLTDFSSPEWSQIPPENPLVAGWGRPHLTWIFVSPAHTRCGLAGTLLNRCMAELARLGFTELSSTFLLDNVPSLLWHWQHGFQLATQRIS